jgi:hypothetical protein
MKRLEGEPEDEEVPPWEAEDWEVRVQSIKASLDQLKAIAEAKEVERKDEGRRPWWMSRL